MIRIARIHKVDGKIWIDLHLKTTDTGYLPPAYQMIEVTEILDDRETQIIGGKNA